MIRELIERSAALDERKTDYTSATKVLSFDGSCNLVVPFGAFKTALELTDWSMSQLCQKLGPPSFRYIQQCPSHLQALNLDYWRRQTDKTWFIRAFDSKCRSVLDEHYTPIPNTEVLEMVEATLGNAPYRIHHSWIDENTLHLKLITLDTPGGDYGLGAYIGNGETGNRQLRVMPFVQRTACQNSIMFSRGSFVHKHYRVSKAFLRGAVQDKLGHAFEVASDRLDQLVDAVMVGIPRVEEVVKRLCKEKGYSQPMHDRILMGMEGSATVFGVINGLTFAAQQLPIEQRIDAETLAGSLLEDRRWITRR